MLLLLLLLTLTLDLVVGLRSSGRLSSTPPPRWHPTIAASFLSCNQTPCQPCQPLSGNLGERASRLRCSTMPFFSPGTAMAVSAPEARE